MKSTGSGTVRGPMVSMAAVMTDAPAPLDGTWFDPYGQLLKMLLPRANSIVIYDRLGVSLWASENDDAELQGLMQQRKRRRTGRARGHRPWLRRATARRADRLLLRLARQRRQPAGRRGGWSAASRTASRARSHWFQGLVRPALQCLERELAAQSSIGQLQRSLSVRDRGLGTAARFGAGRSRWRELHRRLRDAGAELRRPPRLRRRRPADPGQEHRGLPHLVRHAAACRRRDPQRARTRPCSAGRSCSGRQ